MVEGGGAINGREYSQHAIERMAPDMLKLLLTLRAKLLLLYQND